MKRKLYELTPEARAQLAPWHERWLKIALNTDPMTDDDRAKMYVAVEGLYRAAKLKPPPRERIVFVSSPLVASLAGGFAAAIWHMRKDPKFASSILPGATWAATWAATAGATADATWVATWDATSAATRDATLAATVAATWDATGAATAAATVAATWDATVAATADATWAATRDATEAATGAATRDATLAATRAATWDATRAATRDATWDATRAATRAATADATRAATADATAAATRGATLAATRDATWDATRSDMANAIRSALAPIVDWFIQCAASAHLMTSDGGEYTAYIEWVEFMRDICEYERMKRVDFTNWFPWRDASLHGGMRIMHPDFCIVADRPREMHLETVNGRGRLHNPIGPAKSYNDGWSIYAVHGVRVPAQVIEAPQTLTVAQIRAETNAEVRRIMIDRFGAARYLREIGALVRHKDVDQFGFTRRLLVADISDTEPLVMIEVQNSTPEPIGYRPDAGAAGVRLGERWFKKYTLRVPPSMQTCSAALAWTFELPADQYAPAIET